MKVSQRKPTGSQVTLPEKKESTFKRRSIYALIDPSRKQAFYVGISEEPYERFIAHLQCRDANEAKNAYIQQLKQRNLVPAMRIVHCSKATIEIHHRIEAYYIDLFRLLGQPLVNQHLQIGFVLDGYERSLVDAFTYVEFEMPKPPGFSQKLRMKIRKACARKGEI